MIMIKILNLLKIEELDANQELTDQFVKFFKAKDFESAKKSLKEGAHLDVIIYDNGGITALMWARHLNYTKIVQILEEAIEE